MLIVFGGLPGVGKTAIARDLATALGALHLRIDSIEQALRNAGWNVAGEGYSVAYAVAEDNLRLGHRVVADCVNPWPLTRNEWQGVANRAAGHRLPTWSEVLERDYRPWDGDRLVIDTARLDVRESVRTILDSLLLR
jgi:predicted kinase